MNFPELCGTDACPFQPPRDAALELPVGTVRRVAARDGDVDETKRNILKLAAVAGVLGIGAGGAVGGALQYVQPPVVGLTSYPKVLLLDIDGKPLTIGKGLLDPVTGINGNTSELYLFNYPLRNEPNFLLNLTSLVPAVASVPGGIGTPPVIVAYSAICQHLGCPAPAIAYYPPGTCSNTPGGKPFYIHCSCHGSTYDVTNGAANLTGPAVLPLPQVVLTVPTTTGPQANQVYAVGMTPGSPQVNGHLNTLQGDYGVGNASQIATETPVHLCNFLS
ncbi:MAG: Rieske 2Fe-2S domain-containing protein [Thermoplasmata archaeon]